MKHKKIVVIEKLDKRKYMVAIKQGPKYHAVFYSHMVLDEIDAFFEVVNVAIAIKIALNNPNDPTYYTDVIEAAKKHNCDVKDLKVTDL